MNVNFFFKKMTTAGEDRIQQYMAKKLPRLTRLTSKYPEDGVKLRVTAEKFEKHDAYEVEMVLNLGSEKFVAKEDSHTIVKAIDMSFDRLIAQVKKSKEE